MFQVLDAASPLPTVTVPTPWSASDWAVTFAACTCAVTPSPAAARARVTAARARSAPPRGPLGRRHYRPPWPVPQAAPAAAGYGVPTAVVCSSAGVHPVPAPRHPRHLPSPLVPLPPDPQPQPRPNPPQPRRRLSCRRVRRLLLRRLLPLRPLVPLSLMLGIFNLAGYVAACVKIAPTLLKREGGISYDLLRPTCPPTCAPSAAVRVTVCHRRPRACRRHRCPCPCHRSLVPCLQRP